MSETSSGTLFICATPIGNLGDVSPRLLETLRSVAVVYAEDTRRTGKLLEHFGISTKVRSLFAGNEMARTEELVDDVRQGLSVALVSDAGMPGVSDPGALAASRVRDAGGTVTVIPGPSAATMAIAISGLGGERFVFEGFLPRKGREREMRLESVAGERRAVVLFVSPHRLLDDLADLAASIGSERTLAVCREMTKLHEEVWVGSVGDAIEVWSSREPKGEFTVVVSPGAPVEPDPEEAVIRARHLLSQGVSVSEAARRVATESGVARRLIYEVLVEDQEPS